MKKIFIFLIVSFIPLTTWAQIVINEIAWMGNLDSANNEWIELYNSTTTTIDLTDWQLAAQDGSPEIALSGSIPAQSYFLLERTDNQTVPNKEADLIYTGALSNSGEKLSLYDNQKTLVDNLSFSEGWPAGDNETKQTMIKDANQWKNSLNPEGSPKEVNSSEEKKQTPTSTPSINDVQEKENRPPYANAGSDIEALVGQVISFDGSESFDPDGDKLTYLWNFGDGSCYPEEKSKHTYAFPGQHVVSLKIDDGEAEDTDYIVVSVYNPAPVINEIKPGPKSWLEVYNPSPYPADLTDWQIKNKVKSFDFPDKTIINPKQLIVFREEVTQLQLKTEDEVSLLYPNKQVAYQINYQNDKNGQSIAFDGQEYFWTNLPTPGTPNILTINSKNSFEAQNLKEDNLISINSLKNTSTTSKLKTSLLITGSLSSRNKIDYRNDKKYIAQRINKNQEEKTKEKDKKQIASLAQQTIKPQWPKIVLALSIIISFSLFLSWLLILFKKKRNQMRLDF